MKFKRKLPAMTRLRVVIILITIITLMAVSTNYGLYYKMSYILALLLILSYGWTWLNGKWVTVTVKRNVVAARAGEWLEEQLTITNRSRIFPVVWMEVDEKSDMPEHGGEMVISLPSARFGQWSLWTHCTQRGKYDLGPLAVISSDPLGLFQKSRWFGKPQPFTVYPSLVSLPSFALPSSDLPGDSTSRQHTQVVTPAASGIRDYMPGDSYSRVHWRSTARTGKLMVKEFEQEESAKVWIVLDMEERVHRGSGPESSEEYAVTAAASIADKYLQRGLPVGITAVGNIELNLAPKPGVNQFDLIMEGLAELKAEGTVPLADVLSDGETVFNRYCTLVIVAPGPEEAWMGSVQRLSQKRIQSAVVVLDIESFGSGVNGTGKFGGGGSPAAGQIPTCVLAKGEDLSEALAMDYVGKAV